MLIDVVGSSWIARQLSILLLRLEYTLKDPIMCFIYNVLGRLLKFSINFREYLYISFTFYEFAPSPIPQCPQSIPYFL